VSVTEERLKSYFSDVISFILSNGFEKFPRESVQ